MVFVLSADNKLELFKVAAGKPDSVLKKLVHQEKKRLAKKRTHSQMENPEEKKVIEVDKQALMKRIQSGDYDLALHFSRKLVVELNPQVKAKSFSLTPSSSKSDTQNVLVSLHSN